MRAIFFDLDGTLLHFTRDYREVLRDAFADAAGEVPDGAVERYDETFYEAFERCEPDPVRRAFASCETTAEADALVDALLESEIATCRPPERAHEDLSRLAEEYALGVLTNGVPKWQRAKLRAHGLDDYFDVFVASYEAGAHKPDVAPFRLAEVRLPAEEYAMVGDADADIDGASAVGWVPHRYDDEGFGDLPAVLEWE
ncbi:HAD family hydrolase [Haloprofundus salilacus]|uniref:HAD family hydrolase n=1 Tax=Haloprofundus salilacus TaxID=2876190 RepID=UPI001CCEF751|nr:HAD family hydrolase [Haloprofundus salilacus]